MAKLSTKDLLSKLPNRVPFTYFPPVHYNVKVTLKEGPSVQGHVYGQRDGELLMGKTLSLEDQTVVVTDFLKGRIQFRDIKSYTIGAERTDYDEVLTTRVLDNARLNLPGLDIAELERSARVNEAGPRSKRRSREEWFTPAVDGLLE